MRKPAWVFDARAVADPAEIKAAGLSSGASATEMVDVRTVLVTGAVGLPDQPSQRLLQQGDRLSVSTI